MNCHDFPWKLEKKLLQLQKLVRLKMVTLKYELFTGQQGTLRKIRLVNYMQNIKNILKMEESGLSSIDYSC